MLCEVSKKTFEDFIDKYPNELAIQSRNNNDIRIISFIDYPKNYKESDNIEPYIVANETINIFNDKPMIYRIKQAKD